MGRGERGEGQREVGSRARVKETRRQGNTTREIDTKHEGIDALMHNRYSHLHLTLRNEKLRNFLDSSIHRK